MIFLILFGLITLAHSLSDSTRTAQNFCNMKKACRGGPKSVACLYIGSTKPACAGTVVPFDVKYVLKKHNDYRQAIASGKYASQYTTAASMPELTYSDELAQMALYNVKKCKLNHDGCHQTDNFPHAGQNLAVVYYSLGTFDSSHINAYISKFIDDWFSEYKLANMNIINKLPWYTDATGHFLQIIQEKCRHVGCALLYFEKNRKENLLFTCNYGYGNVQSLPVYTKGPPASKCISKSKSYSALCSI